MSDGQSSFASTVQAQLSALGQALVLAHSRELERATVAGCRGGGGGVGGERPKDIEGFANWSGRDLRKECQDRFGVSHDEVLDMLGEKARLVTFQSGTGEKEQLCVEDCTIEHDAEQVSVEGEELSLKGDTDTFDFCPILPGAPASESCTKNGIQGGDNNSPRSMFGAGTHRSFSGDCVEIFVLRKAWRSVLQEQHAISLSSVHRSNTAHIAMLLNDEAEEDEDDDQSNALKRFMIAPNSSLRLSWDVIGTLLIFFDFIYIPLLLFDPPETGFTKVATWIARLFWTFDIGFTFLTGTLLDNGSLEMSPRLVALSYFKTWFLFDILLVLSDWMEMVIEATITHSTGDMALVGRFLRAFRLLRMLRLIRIIKLSVSAAQASPQLVSLSEKLGLLMNILRSTVSLVIFAHIIACLWYRLGDSDPSGWVEGFGFDQRPLSERYAVSVHWAMTQFIGPMDVMARTERERIFTIVVLITCFVLAAAFVSTITTSMTRLDFLNNEKHTQMTLLKRYLTTQGVSNRLSMRVTKNAEHAAKMRMQNIHESGVPLLQLISEPLRIEVHFEVYSRIMSSHAAFAIWSSEAPVAMRHVCHKAINMNVLTKGDIRFSTGESHENPAMLFVANGLLKYGQEHNLEEVFPGQWVAEAALWTHKWVHRGVLQAQTECRLLELDAAKFQECIKHRMAQDLDIHPARYAKFFLQELNSLPEQSVTDLDCGFGLSPCLEQVSANMMSPNRASNLIGVGGATTPNGDGSCGGGGVGRSPSLVRFSTRRPANRRSVVPIRREGAGSGPGVR